MNYSLPGLISPIVVICWDLDLKDYSPPPWHCTPWGGRGRKKHEGETSAVQENCWSLSLDQLLKQSPGCFSRTLIQYEAPRFVLMMLLTVCLLALRFIITGLEPEDRLLGPSGLLNLITAVQLGCRLVRKTSYYVTKIK